LPSTPVDSVGHRGSARDRAHAVSRDRTKSIEAVDSVAAVIAQIAHAPERGVILADGSGNRCDWSTNSGGRRIQQVGGLATPAVEWIDWDRQVARVAPGATVSDVSAALLTQGWCLPILAGNPQRTIAAMVATSASAPHQLRCESLGNTIQAIELVDGTGCMHRFSVGDEDSRAFWAVIGGLGLLGVMTGAELAIRPVSSGWLLVDTVRVDSFDEILRTLNDSRGDRYCTALLDMSSGSSSPGRGTVLSAKHARVDDLPTSRQHAALTYEPGAGPNSPRPIRTKIRQTQVGRLFAAIKHKSSPPHTDNELQTVADFFHNRAVTPTSIPDSSAWINYDFCVPVEAVDVVSDFLDRAVAGQIVGLAATLSRVDSHKVGPLGWGQAGFAVHLALPTEYDGLPTLLDSFDERIADVGGCVHLGTDSRVRPDVVSHMYPKLDDWHSLRSQFDPQSHLQSDLSRRLSL
jgi:decaprenylphospho-beta-D-ribofuranose 2-oxidase